MRYKLVASILLVCALVSSAIGAASLKESEAIYVGGNVGGLKPGAIGKLDLSSQTEVSFVAGSARIEIPFEEIDSYSYTSEVAHHLGVLPAIFVGLVKKRQRVHRIRIDFRGPQNVPQTAIFEVPKEMPKVVLAVLQVHEPHCSTTQPACSIPRAVKVTSSAGSGGGAE